MGVFAGNHVVIKPYCGSYNTSACPGKAAERSPATQNTMLGASQVISIQDTR